MLVVPCLTKPARLYSLKCVKKSSSLGATVRFRGSFDGDECLLGILCCSVLFREHFSRRLFDLIKKLWNSQWITNFIFVSRCWPWILWIYHKRWRYQEFELPLKIYPCVVDILESIWVRYCLQEIKALGGLVGPKQNCQVMFKCT